MASSTSSPRQGLLKGTLQVFIAEALLLPTGLLTAVFLTRWLGPEGYGFFTLTATIIAWLEWSATSIFGRTTIKFVSEAEDWRSVGTTVLQQHLIVGLGVALALGSLAGSIAHGLGEPRLTHYLLLFALEIPLFALARAHRGMLVGLGRYSGQAIAGASRWIARLLFIVLFVGLGFSVSGAILGSVGASFVELLVVRCYIRPALFSQTAFPAKKLWDYAVPLTLFALSMQLYTKLDLLMLKVLGGTVEQVGIYGAAQNLSIIPALFAQALAPVLLSTVNRSLKDGAIERAKTTSQQAMRGVLWMLPLAALMAGSAPAIVDLVFGVKYAPAAPLLAWLMFGAIAQVMIAVATSILIAADKPNWTVALAAPMLPLAGVGYFWLIPPLSDLGAALINTLVAGLGAIATVIAVHRIWQILPPYQTGGRSLLVSSLIYALAANLPGTGFWLLLKLGAIVPIIPLTYWLLGEFSSAEIALARAWIRLPTKKLT